MSEKENKVDKLEDVEFFDVMQSYRTAGIANQDFVVKCFSNVKKYIREEYLNDELSNIKAVNSELKDDLDKAVGIIKKILEESHLNIFEDTYVNANNFLTSIEKRK